MPVAKETRKRVPCLEVRQWLREWDHIRFNKSSAQSKPEPSFFIASLKASELKALTGVYRRTTKGGGLRVADPNVQRGHEEERSRTIREFVQFGYPWCEMSEAKREQPDADDLRKPGWLPTAILVNILPAGSIRQGKKLAAADQVSVELSDSMFHQLALPESFSDSGWVPTTIFPLEVIDGQHRLWAFENFNPGSDYELPVVLFNGLDHSWQAYLFWSVNITPKKINRSLAFDLYPLLRGETWLDKLDGHAIYRETRCQELVEALWRHPSSPWVQRINMLGEKSSDLPGAQSMVTQAAWIRSLMATFIKLYEGGHTKIGGLFGAPKSSHETVLPWTRPMQAAFLIHSTALVRDAVEKSKAEWAKSLRSSREPDLFDDQDLDRAFYGKNSLLSTDQGIRGLLHVINDLCFVHSDELNLGEWTEEEVFLSRKPSKARQPATDDDAVTAALTSLEKTKASDFLRKMASTLASYDWRTSSAPGLTEAERLRQAVFRGSSGYKELRTQLLRHLQATSGSVGASAKSALAALS